MRLMSPAAFRYDSSSVAESACSSAMLSKLALIESSGSHEPASTVIASRSRTARAYSARFSRWNTRVPGLGRATAAAFIFVSSVEMNAA